MLMKTYNVAIVDPNSSPVQHSCIDDANLCQWQNRIIFFTGFWLRDEFYAGEEIDMYKTADYIRYKLAFLKINLPGIVVLWAEATTASAAAHAFCHASGSWLNRVSDVWVRNHHLVLQQDKGKLWTLKGLWVFEDCSLPALEVSICSSGVLRWAAPGMMWVNYRSWASCPSHGDVTIPVSLFAAAQERDWSRMTILHHRCKENIWSCKHSNLVWQTWDFPWSCQFTGNSVYSCPLQPNLDWMHLLGEISQELERLLVHQFYKTATGK